MAGLIKNAAPDIINLGTEDLSIRELPIDPITYPNHLPIFFIYASKGTTVKKYGGISDAINTYGMDTFDPGKKWYNHATRFLTGIASNGNMCVTKRIVPPDAGVRSNITIWMDVLETMVPNYKRTSFGEYLTDNETNSYVLDDDNPYIPGYRVKFISSYDTKETGYGLQKPSAGTMKTQQSISTLYPLFEFKAKYQGSYYNNIGFTLDPLYNDQQQSATSALNKAFNYNLSLVTRQDENSSFDIKKTLFGELGSLVSLNEFGKNADTDALINIEWIFGSQWFSNESDFDGMYFYRDIYKRLTTEFVKKEREFVDSTEKVWADNKTAPTMAWYDFTTDDKDELLEEGMLMNPFSCKSSKNVKYYTLLYDYGISECVGNQREITFSSTTPIFLSGGSDGTLSNENFEKIVVKEIEKYSDINSDVHDLAVSVESIFYDSGFTLETKKKLTHFIALRKDTILVYTTHDASLKDKSKGLSDSRAIAVALKNRLKLCPESEYYGTNCMRGIVTTGTGLLRDGSSNHRIPLSYEIAIKSAKFMGGGEGRWKREYFFDSQPNNIINELINIEPAFIPQSIKPTLWNDGLVWAMPNGANEFYLPAIQTVYDDDTSVLNSYFSVMAISKLTKIAAQLHREFTGSMSMTSPQFIDALNTRASRLVDRLFAGIVTVIPEAYITDEDEARGYSWHFKFNIYIANMKTVMVYNTAARRASDLS